MSERASCWVRRLRAGRGEAFTLLCLLAGGVGPAPSAMAQLGAGPLGQYMSPGGMRVPDRESEAGFERAMEDARWRFGGLRVAPFLGIRNAQIHSNVFGTSEEQGEEVTDFTGTFGAGLDGYFKTGSHLFYSLEAQPDYVFWLDLDERNQLIGRYSASANAYFNRLTFSVGARRYEVEQIVTPEFAQPVTSLQEGIDASLSLRLGERFSISVSGDVSNLQDRSESEGDPRVPDFSSLDREQATAYTSLVWTLPNGLELGGGWHVTRADFDEDSRPLSVDGAGPWLSLYGDGNKLDFRVEMYQSSLEPRAGSEFPERDVVGGRFETSFDTGSRIGFDLYGQTNQLFSIDESYSDFTHQRFGVRFDIPFGDRAGVDLFVEIGEDDYEEVSADVPARTDDAFSWGAAFRVPLPRKFPDGLHVQLGYRQTELDSNLPGLDREYGGPIFNVAYSVNAARSLVWQ